MSTEKCVQFSLLNKENVVTMIETLRIKSLENQKKMENMLKSYDSLQLLENQINMCFELRCEIEDYENKLKELELKEDYTESSDTLKNFIANISNVHKNDSRPEALIVVTTEEVGKLYIHLIRRLALRNVIFTTIRALTARDVNVTLSNVNTALLDGSEEDYAKFSGNKSVRLIIASYVPVDRTFFIKNDRHRDSCFEYVSKWESAGQRR